MKSSIKRILAWYLLSIMTLTALAGCQGNGSANATGETQTQASIETDDNTSGRRTLDLEGYLIVLPADSKDTVERLSAYELKEAIAKIGYETKIRSDDSLNADDKNVILLGKTSITVGNMPTGNEYSIKIDQNGRVQIAAETYYGYRAALSYIVKNGGIPKDVDQKGDATTDLMKKPDGSIRVMFYNVYGWNNWKKANGTDVKNPNVYFRQDLKRDLLSAYAPDVIGFSEYKGDTYHVGFNPTLASLGYTQVETEKGNNNFTPLFYKADKLEIVESGYTRFTKNDEYNSKGVTWAVFQVKAGSDAGKKVGVFATHYRHSPDDITILEADLERVHNAQETLALMNTVSEKYSGVPLILGGDLNFWDVWGSDKADSLNDPNDKWEGQNGLPYTALTQGGLKLLSNIAGVKTNFWTSNNTTVYEKSYHGYFTFDEKKQIYNLNSCTISSAYNLDYIFLGKGKENVTVKNYIVLKDDVTLRASDHKPVFADMILK